MKMFMVCGVVVFCGFLSLSAGETCIEAKARMNKDKMGEAISMVLNGEVVEKIQNLISPQSEGMNPSQLERMNPLSMLGPNSATSGTTVKIKKAPEVKISKGSDRDILADVTSSLILELPDETTVEEEKTVKLILEMTEDGLEVKECVSSPTDADVKISFLEDLAKPLKESIMQTVKVQFLSVIDDNMCSVVQEALEKHAPKMNVLSPLKNVNFKIQSMEENKEDLSLGIGVWGNGALSAEKQSQNPEGWIDAASSVDEWSQIPEESEGKERKPYEESCTDKMMSSVEPHCPMQKNALTDIIFQNSVIGEHLKSIENLRVSLENSNGETDWLSYEDVYFADSSEGGVVTYELTIMTCEDEDPSNCKQQSFDECSFDAKMGIQDSELKIVYSESCDENAEPDLVNSDHDSRCHTGSCTLTKVIPSVPMILPGGMMDSDLAEIKMDNCGDQTVISAIIDLLSD